ncbi:hypothetical protein CC86DRAFT_409196 [Ophiobolus disseminans]|uniref:Uncharacterized protein n=1 Tax=Ophiobolus disseminans TaxID=1469910 RepID=A0A6A6ZS44_9PLEO|nr:hypothetical protein CC86DRAFT_409196 [Ophiobolus disseminans]
MAQHELSERKDMVFDATHLNIPIDLNNPPPSASMSFLKIQQQVKTTWDAFEVVENSLVRLDDNVHAEVLNYISSHRSATKAQLQVQRARLTVQLHEPRIVQAEGACRELERTARLLEEAARKELTTVEARAALEIDVPVIRNCLATTREIIGVAEAQLNGARVIYNRSELS